MRKVLLLLIVPFCFFACNKAPVTITPTSAHQDSIDHQIILAYIDSNHLVADSEANGLYYVPVVVGSGPHPTINSTVTVTYKGYLTNGSVFDQEGPVSFTLNNVIQGWQEGIPLMQAGGKATLLIPSSLGYGTQANGSIPANSVLIFDVTLNSFQ
jgi:FKBP-type peptidyl-prolyl cis-trans isomerase FkpA